MELDNANLNGGDVVLNNLHPMIIIFSKILKIELNKGLRSSF